MSEDFREITLQYVRRKTVKKSVEEILAPPVKDVLRRDRLLRRGVPLADVAREFGVCRERMGQLARKNNLHEIWKKSNIHYRAKTFRKRRYAELNGIVDSLLWHKVEQAIDDVNHPQWPEASAVRYRAGCNGSNIRGIDHLLRIFTAYQQNSNASKSDLAKKAKVCPSAIAIVLNSSNLRDTKYRSHPSEEQKSLIERVRRCQMRTIDISAFTDISTWIISERRKGVKLSKRAQQFNHYRASQIYEAMDLGYSIQETAELMDLSTFTIERYNKRRRSASNVIINMLRKAYPDQEIKTPYLGSVDTSSSSRKAG